MQGAWGDPGRRGRGKPRSSQQKSMHRKRDTEVSQYSAESRRRSRLEVPALSEPGGNQHLRDPIANVASMIPWCEDVIKRRSHVAIHPSRRLEFAIP